MTNTENRLDYVDLLKGIGILLVIIGHTISSAMRGIIFSFHMPLFFMTSGMTYSFAVDRSDFYFKTRKATKKLLMPAIILICVRYALHCIKQILIGGGQIISIWDLPLSLLFSSGVDVRLNGWSIPRVYEVWFLVVLFFVREVCDLLHGLIRNIRWRMLTVCTLTILGVWMGQVCWLPFSFDIVLACTVFFYFGRWLKEKNLYRRTNLVTMCVMGIASFGGMLIEYTIAHNYLELATREYPLFPLCYLIAFIIVVGLLPVCKVIRRWGYISKMLTYVGRNSYILFCVHCLDFLWRFLWDIGDSGINMYISVVIRVGLDMLLFYMFIKIRHRLMLKYHQL